MRFNYLQSESYIKMPVSPRCYIPTSLPQEQAAKTIMVSVVRIQVFSIITVEEDVANTCMKPRKSPFPRLATGLLLSNARIQLKIVKY